MNALRRAREAFVEFRGSVEVPVRAAAIATLPQKAWRGVPVFGLDCEGPFGRGPHRIFVPEYVCWSLIDLRHFLCPFHR